MNLLHRILNVRNHLGCLFALALMASLAGCSSDPTTVPVNDSSDDNDVVTVEGTTLGSIRGKNYTVPFNDAGTIVLSKNQTVSATSSLRLFDFQPAEVPESGILTIGNAQAAFDGADQAVLPLFGTATVNISIAKGTDSGACDNAKFMAELDLRLTTGIASIIDGEHLLTAPVLDAFANNDVTLCVDVEADFDGELSLSSFEVAFDGGESIPTLLLTNNSTEAISLLGPGELFSAATSLNPGATRLVTAEGATGAITVRAGLLSEGLLASDVCPAPTGRNYVAQVGWDGESFLCEVEEDPPLEVDNTTPETLQVPLFNRFGDAAVAEPTNTIDGIDYAVNRVLYAATDESDEELSVDLDLDALGLQRIDAIYVATYSDLVADLENGVTVATLRLSSPGTTTREEVPLVLGQTTADWSHDRPEHESAFGGTRHDKPRSLYDFDTRIESSTDYVGAVFGVTVELDPPRTISTISLALADDETLGVRDEGMEGRLGQAISALTVVGPPAGTSTETDLDGDDTSDGDGDTGDDDSDDGDDETGGDGDDDPVVVLGSATGVVNDATSGMPLAGVTVSVDDGTPSTTTDADGSYTFDDVEVGAHTITVSRSGFVSITTIIVVAEDNPAETTFEMFAAGTVTGEIVDAQTGDPLSGVTISISGADSIATTGADGSFTMTDAPEGERTLSASRTGYVTGTVPVTIDPDQPAELSIGLLAVGGGGSGIAVTLAWGSSPRDLDLHMSGPDGSGGRFHIAFYALNPVDHGSLDLDDTSSFGPETITVTSINDAYVAGDYQVWIHNFSGEADFDTSGGIVTLYAGGTQFAQFQVDDATGTASDDIWRVVEFSIDAEGTVTETNELQSFTAGTAQSEF